jgi:MoaA/NifB/PqqE/SkfB family radical SAM enzyme
MVLKKNQKYSGFLYFLEKINMGEIFITNKCNNECVFCSVCENDESPSLEQIKYQLYMLRERNVEYVSFTGGEPTENDKLLFLVKLAKRLGFKNIEIKSNGKNYKNKKFLNDLVRSGVNFFHVAIHGHNKGIHDALTQKKDSFDDVVEGFRNLDVFSGIKVRTCTVINRMNYRNLPELADFLLTFRNIDCMGFAFLHPVSKVLNNSEELAVPYSEANSFLIEALKKNENAGLSCHIDNYPPCLLRGFERHMKHSFLGLPSQFSDSSVCPYEKECIYSDFCEGMDDFYVQKWGWMKNVIPVSLNDIKYTVLRENIYTLPRSGIFKLKTGLNIRIVQDRAMIDLNSYFILLKPEGVRVIKRLKAGLDAGEIFDDVELARFIYYLHENNLLLSEEEGLRLSPVRSSEGNSFGNKWIYEYPLYKMISPYPFFE